MNGPATRRALRLILAGVAIGTGVIAGGIVWIMFADADLDRGLRLDQGDWTLRDVNRRSSLW